MRDPKGRRWWSRCVAAVAVVFTFIGVLGNRPAIATPVQLFISNFGSGTVLSFNSDTSAFIRNLTTGVSTGAAEGLTCLPIAGGGCTLFVSNNSTIITAYAITGLSSARLGTFFTSPNSNSRFAALSLSASTTPTLYAADPGTGNIYAIPISSPISPGGPPTPGTAVLTSTSASHDVAVGNSDVYLAYWGPGTGSSVLDAPDTPTSPLAIATLPFILNGTNGLIHPAGMVVDNNGDVWVSQFPGLNVTTGGGVYEFSPTGTCLAEVSSSPTGTCITNVTSPLIIGPFGLALGPDGNVYVADFTGNSVEEINLSDGDLVTSFITNPSGCMSSMPPPDCLSDPKYLTFSNIPASVPEPGSLVLLFPALVVLTVFARALESSSRFARSFAH